MVANFTYNFKMVYLRSNKFSHADGLSRLIPKYKEPLEDTVIAFLQSEGELKITLCNSARELPLTLDQIKLETLRDEYINRIKTKILEKDQRTNRRFLYMQRSVTLQRTRRDSVDIAETYSERFSRWPSEELLEEKSYA